jgi:hypothetical protein
VVEGDGAPLMAEGRVRPHPARAGSAVRFVAVSDLLVLAAIERAECHGQLEGVLWDRVLEHLGFLRAAATTRKLRPQVDALIAAGDVRQFRRGGSKVWGLTDAGRARLARAREDGEALELPEAPQHRQWRRARAKAVEEIEWLRDQLRSTFEQAQRSLSDDQADPAAWLAHGERVQSRCGQPAFAYYCLHKWPEPVDTQPDTKALRGWSQSLVRGTLELGQGDPVMMASKLRRVRGANGE